MAERMLFSTGGFELRDYQVRAVETALKQLETVRSTLIVLPTGCGKTVTFASIAKRWMDDGRGRVLLVAHRDELIHQGASTITKITGDWCDIEMGTSYANRYAGKAPVVVTSVQTMSRRFDRFRPEDFSLIIEDEAHHSPAETYCRVRDHFFKNPQARLIGATATPDRSDAVALGKVFDAVAIHYTIADAIEDGYLVRVRQRFVQLTGMDLAAIKTVRGDLHPGQLGEVMEDAGNVLGVVKPTMDISQGRKTIVFAASVAQAEKMCVAANGLNPGCARWVCGHKIKCPMEARRQNLVDFKKGKFQFLFNVGVLLEGYDEPGIEMVVMARPTKSRSLYAQMLGRGVRPLPGVIDGLWNKESRREAIASSAKPSLLVLDFVGNSGQHKLVSTADILGGKYSQEVVSVAGRKAEESEVDTLESLEAAEEERKKRIVRIQGVDGTVTYSVREVDPFNVLDLFKPEESPFLIGCPPTERQLRSLNAAGIPSIGLTRTQAESVLREISFRRANGLCDFNLAVELKKQGLPTDVTPEDARRLVPPTEKQLRMLRRAGIDTKGMTRETATKHQRKLFVKWKYR